MPGSPQVAQMPDAVAVQCPVYRVTITPCAAAELSPLLDHLRANRAAAADMRFPRGTVTEDGRLDLCKQSLGTDNCLQITEALRHNTRVRSLMLGTDAIGDSGARAVALLAAENPGLEALYLGCNNIGPDGARELGSTLERAASGVTGLWLKRNPLGAEGAMSLARMLNHNRQLRVLDLVNTDLRCSGVRALVDALCTGNQSLQALYLSGNGLSAAAATDIARLLREAPQLRALYLSVNHLGDEGAAMLAEALGDNHTLQTLELASNGIGPGGASALFEAVPHSFLQTLSLGYAPSTQVLGAQANYIGAEGARLAAVMLEAVVRCGSLMSGVLAYAKTAPPRCLTLRLLASIWDICALNSACRKIWSSTWSKIGRAGRLRHRLTSA